MKKEDNVHCNHRNRMRAKYERFGADAFDTYQLIEMLLFNSIRQGDTNPAAHKVAESLGAGGILSADAKCLAEADGIGEKSAALLRLSCDTTLRLLRDSIASKPLDSEFARMLYVFTWFVSKPRGCVGAVYLDSRSRVRDASLLSSGRMFRCEDYGDRICEAVQQLRAQKVIICHNHKNGVSEASVEDRFLTEYLSRTLSAADIEFIGHYIVTSSDCVRCPDCTEER